MDIVSLSNAIRHYYTNRDGQILSFNIRKRSLDAKDVMQEKNNNNSCLIF